uniref:hypothetical protein n=1 Tax=Microbispora cellulosiformans TaxID=2614688 RepID=UPI00177D2652|nr:hypothetical protein [Microbispora cellulosiformans]
MTGYLDELTALLRAGGVPDEQAGAIVADLASYADETGADPEEEFGPVDRFAEQLLAARSPEADAAGATEWRWTADVFADRQMLARLGDQGWEVDRVDALGRFVSHRDPERPQRWEYRRERVTPGGARTPAARLAPEGWEPCGTWVCFEYFKRPKAASVGPAAQIDSPPAAPARSIFFSRQFYVVTAALLIVLVALWLLVGRSGGEGTAGGEGADFFAGLAAGGCTTIAILALVLWWSARRRG